MQKYFKQIAERKSQNEAGILIDEVDLRITRGPRGAKGGLFKTFLQPGDSKTDPMSTNLQRTYSLMKRMNKPVVLRSISSTNDTLQSTHIGNGEPEYPVNTRASHPDHKRSMYETEQTPQLVSVNQSKTITHKVNESIPVNKANVLHDNQKRSQDNRENRCEHNNKMKAKNKKHENPSYFSFNHGSVYNDHTNQMILSPSVTTNETQVPPKPHPNVEALVKIPHNHVKQAHRERKAHHQRSKQREFAVQHDATRIDYHNGTGMFASLLANFGLIASKVIGLMTTEVSVPLTRTDPHYGPTVQSTGTDPHYGPKLPSTRTNPHYGPKLTSTRTNPHYGPAVPTTRIDHTSPDVGFDAGLGDLVASDLTHREWQGGDNVGESGESAAEKLRPLLPFVFGMFAVSLVILFLTTLYGGFYIIPLTRLQDKHTVRGLPQALFTPPSPKPLIKSAQPENRASDIPNRTGLGKRRGKKSGPCNICFEDMDLTKMVRAYSKNGRSRCCKIEPSNPNAIHVHDIKKRVWKVICGAETVTRHFRCVISMIFSKIQKYAS